MRGNEDIKQKNNKNGKEKKLTKPTIDLVLFQQVKTLFTEINFLFFPKITDITINK